MVVQGELGEDVIVPWRARRVLCHGGFETGSFVVLSRSRTCSRSNGFDQSLIRTCLIISPDAFDVTSYPRFLFCIWERGRKLWANPCQIRGFSLRIALNDI